MRLLSCREEFANDMRKLQDFIYTCLNHPYTLGEFYRTPAQQAMYYEGWEYKDGFFQLTGRKSSKVRKSQHQKKLAGHIKIWGNMHKTQNKLASNLIYFDAGRFWCSLNKKNRWGGNFGVKKKNWFSEMGWDRCHFERRS